MKPHTVVAQTPGTYDDCYTPPYALWPILPSIPDGTVIWEPCAGDDYLADALRMRGFTVISSDLARGADQDVLTMPTPPGVGLIVTNPPYSIKRQVIASLLARGLPWAMLVPFETTASKRVRDLFPAGSMEQLYLDGRVSFRMPHKGWAGAGSQFDTIWLSYRFTGRQISEGALPHRLDFHRKVRAVLAQGREPTREELFAWSGFGPATPETRPAQLTFDLAA